MTNPTDEPTIEEPHDETYRALDAMATDPHAPDDRVSRDAADLTHPRLYRGDQPHTHGTPPSAELTRLSFDDLHYNQDTARELLNDAADLVRRALFTEPAASAVLHEAAKRWETDGAAWLARFEELGR